MKFIVSARHVAAEYALDGVTFQDGYVTAYRLSQDSYSKEWSADANPFGSGKDYASPEAAIRGLLSDNGCTAISITRV